MAKLVFDGWEVGMRKIPFIKLLHEKGRIDLAEAKRMKDRLVDNNETIEIDILDERLAKEILDAAKKLGVKGRLE